MQVTGKPGVSSCGAITVPWKPVEKGGVSTIVLSSPTDPRFGLPPAQRGMRRAGSTITPDYEGPHMHLGAGFAPQASGTELRMPPS